MAQDQVAETPESGTKGKADIRIDLYWMMGMMG